MFAAWIVVSSLAQPELFKYNTVAVVLTAEDERDLMGLGLKLVLWRNSTEQFESLLQVRNLVWFCRDPEMVVSSLRGHHGHDPEMAHMWLPVPNSSTIVVLKSAIHCHCCLAIKAAGLDDAISCFI